MSNFVFLLVNIVAEMSYITVFLCMTTDVVVQELNVDKSRRQR